MKPKKNPKADLSKRSILFFQIGMILVLFLTWRAIEWKTYDKDDLDLGMVNMDALEEEDVPITQMEITPPPPPPPPPPAPVEIEVVEDEAEVEETIIESTETNQEEIVEVKEVEVVEEVEEIGDVPFAVIEDVPIFPGCEGLTNNNQRKACMQEKIAEFVKDEFDTGLGSELGLSGINRVNIQFRIEKSGDVTVIGVRGPHPRLEQEARDVINSLPKMQPGKQRGKPVGVLYAMPITFKVQD
ncbi:MAG TPA: energy transducer TonB [Salinimicrobium sp.]|nr:energy transducer TonB [Salinimicrobium sp.]